MYSIKFKDYCIFLNDLFIEHLEPNTSLLQNQDKQINEQEATQIINQMVGIGGLQIDENDIKDIEMNVIKKVVDKPDSFTTIIFIEDVELNFQIEDEEKDSFRDIGKDIMLTFIRNREANDK